MVLKIPVSKFLITQADKTMAFINFFFPFLAQRGLT